MDNNFWIEMAKQVPSAIAVIGTVYLFLKAEDQREVRRITNAEKMGDVQRNHEIQVANIQKGQMLEVNNLWATTVKNIMTTQDTSNQTIVSAVREMHKEMVDQYEKMGITKDLYDVAKQMLNKGEKQGAD